MRQITIPIYTFDELSESAKDRAIQDYQSACGFAWEDEWMDSIKALAVRFGGTVADYAIGWSNPVTHSWMKFKMPGGWDRDDIRQVLDDLGSYNPETLRGDGECKLTGYCGDEDAIDGFRKAFIESETEDLGKLMQSAFRTWIKAAHADYVGFFEHENFADHCEVNNYEFHADGSFYRKPQ